MILILGILFGFVVFFAFRRRRDAPVGIVPTIIVPFISGIVYATLIEIMFNVPVISAGYSCANEYTNTCVNYSDSVIGFFIGGLALRLKQENVKKVLGNNIHIWALGAFIILLVASMLGLTYLYKVAS